MRLVLVVVGGLLLALTGGCSRARVEAPAVLPWSAALAGEPAPADPATPWTVAMPLSCTLDGTPTALAAWTPAAGPWAATTPGVQARTITWRQPGGGLALTLAARAFTDIPAIEWLPHLQNTAPTPSPLVGDLQALDLRIPLPAAAAVRVWWTTGSRHAIDDYTPQCTPLAPGSALALPAPGACAQDALPYWNVQWPGGGVVLAVGWTGQWQCRIARDAAGLHLTAGQQDLRARLEGGERIRLPRILLVPWQGDDRRRGQNLLRRLLVAHYLPRIDGQIVGPRISTGPGPIPTYQDVIAHAADFARCGVENIWVDATWFPGDFPNGVGNWWPTAYGQPDQRLPLAAATHAAGMSFMCWFEPERAGAQSTLATQHPSWVVLHHQEADWPCFLGGGMVNLGDPEARAGITAWVIGDIERLHIDVFRHDRNFHPILYLRTLDTPGRAGIAENRYVEGLYAFWDALHQRFPRLVIDDCNWRCTGPDLECQLRTSGSWTCAEYDDGGSLPILDQAVAAAVAEWLPLFGDTCANAGDPFATRAVGVTGLFVGGPGPALLPLVREVHERRPLVLGDVYPLTPIDRQEDHWHAVQFDRPDLGAGCVLAFRRAHAPASTFSLALQGIDPHATYQVWESIDYTPTPLGSLQGAALASLVLRLEPRQSMYLRYQRVPAER